MCTTIFAISPFVTKQFLNPTPKKSDFDLWSTPKRLDFDLTTHPVSAVEAQDLYEKLRWRRRHISRDIEDQCKKECRKEVKPCSILLRLEEMNGGIERNVWGSEGKEIGSSGGDLDRGLRVLDDCDDRRFHALMKVERKCKDECRVGLKACPILGELEEMHEREVGAGWL